MQEAFVNDNYLKVYRDIPSMCRDNLYVGCTWKNKRYIIIGMPEAYRGVNATEWITLEDAERFFVFDTKEEIFDWMKGEIFDWMKGEEE